MSDRKSVEIFSGFLSMLGANPSDEHKAMAREVWRMGRKCDFCWEELDDEAATAAIRLGVARRGMREDCPEDGETMLWLGEDFDEDTTP